MNRITKPAKLVSIGRLNSTLYTSINSIVRNSLLAICNSMIYNSSKWSALEARSHQMSNRLLFDYQKFNECEL